MEQYRIPAIIFFVTLLVICVLAIAGIVLYAAWERRAFNKTMRLNRRDYLAETMLKNRKRTDVWYDEYTKFTKEDYERLSKQMEKVDTERAKVPPCITKLPKGNTWLLEKQEREGKAK